MANLNDLAKRMKRIALLLPTEGARCAVETALMMELTLVRETPVDTSLHLSNWQASLDVPFDNEIEAYFEGSFGSTRKESGDAALFVAKNNIQSKKPGETIFLSNNGPVIRELDDGTISKQPGGFVQKSLLVGKRYIKTFKMKLR